MSAPELRALTGARFVAALHVVVYHALRPQLVDAADPARRFLGAGGSAVTFFFVLSGFVLTYAHFGTSPSRDTGSPPTGARGFFRARFARIAPVYWLALLLVAPLGAIARHKGLVEDPLGPLSFVLVATGLQAWVPEAALRWNPPAWSLSCELFFYALFPLIAAFMVRARVKTALAVAFVAWAAGVAVVAGAAAAVPDVAAARPGDESALLNALKLSPLARLPEFVVGIAAARVLLARSWRVPWIVGAGALVVAAVAAAAGVAPYVVLHNGLLAPLFALGILALANGDGPLARVLSMSPLRVLGNASYALYLLHVPLMIWTAAVLKTKELSSTAALAAGMLAIPLSVLVYAAVERPARERLRGKRA